MPRPRRPMPDDFAEVQHGAPSYAAVKRRYRAGGSTIARWRRELRAALRAQGVSLIIDYRPDSGAATSGLRVLQNAGDGEE